MIYGSIEKGKTDAIRNSVKAHGETMEKVLFFKKTPEKEDKHMRKMNRIIPIALACAIFAAQPAQAAIIIRSDGTTTDTKNTNTKTTGTQSGNEGGPGYENSTSNPSNSTTDSTTGQSQVSAEAKAAADAIAKPTISAEAGILYDVTNGRVLFEKNADEKLAPASTTKLMTALLVLEKANLDDKVTFSKTAVTNLESGAVKIGLVEGDQVSVKDSLYALLLKSANEVANGLAEHVSGSISVFAELMNARAAELGCTNTHFVNPNGLNSDQQYTTCRDMAKIAAAAFANKTLCEIDSTLSYKFPATKAAAARTITPGHKMLYPNDSRYYAGIVGGKTGYTSKAGNTLVTCVEKNGVRMVAVILKSKSTHYEDTKKMLDYGYQYVNTEKSGSTSAGKQTTAGHWVQDNGSWRYEFADGTKAVGTIYTIDAADFGFDTDGKMVTGWKMFGTEWHYFETNGKMIKSAWRQDSDKWFYLDAEGKIAKNTTIDNKYVVGADGAWVQ